MIDELKLPLCHWGPIKDFYPFFLPLCVPDGRGGTRYLTEDYSFSHPLQQIGVSPMADTAIKFYHFGKYGFSFEDLNPRRFVQKHLLDEPDKSPSTVGGTATVGSANGVNGAGGGPAILRDGEDPPFDIEAT